MDKSFKRKLIQICSAIIYNADIKHFFSKDISLSKAKNVCVPGLNCYSCPAAVASCPLGSLQNFLGTGRIPFFILGFLLLIGILLGRAVCAFLCPVGLIQELLYKIPLKKIKKNKTTLLVSRRLSITKYIFLFLCISIPLFSFIKNGYGTPIFCSWFCPAGTIQAGIPLVLLQDSLRQNVGTLFFIKLSIAFLLTFFSTVYYRPFCTIFCPLGAIYSFFNKKALFGIKVEKEKCISCGKCTSFCKMPTKKINDRECIRCGECIKVCSKGAINFKTFGNL